MPVHFCADMDARPVIVSDYYVDRTIMRKDRPASYDALDLRKTVGFSAG